MSEVTVEVSVGDGVAELLTRDVEEVVRHVLTAEQVGEGELSLALVSDAQIQQLNEQYLGHSGPTDVISFHLHSPGQPPVGDVYIGTEQAARQAAELGVTLEEEILRLAVHGTLHVLGFDHPEGEGREESPMYRRQEELLAAWLAAHRHER